MLKIVILEILMIKYKKFVINYQKINILKMVIMLLDFRKVLNFCKFIREN